MLGKPEIASYGKEEVFSNLFRLKIPLPIQSLGHLNAYLIISKNQRFLIDTGMSSDEAFDVLKHQLGEIGVKPQEITEILVTHFHIDHAGLVPRLRKLSGAKIIVSTKEAMEARKASMKYGDRIERFSRFYEEAGVPKELVKQMLKATPIHSYKAVYEELGKPSIHLCEGDKVNVGEYHFGIIMTPGHSPGHICLFEPNLKVLIAGDHLLPTITPHVTLWGNEGNPVANYLASLDKVKKLNVDYVLPGHQEPFNKMGRRIEELKTHLNARTAKILSEIRKEELTAYQIASRIEWKVNFSAWKNFTLFQKFLATGETMANLKFLEDRSQVEKIKGTMIKYRTI